MPNGGSDCCATCWFNSKNEGEAGFSHAGAPGPASCTICKLAIENPFYTYCANHPHRRAQQDRIPIGPVFIHDATTGGRMALGVGAQAARELDALWPHVDVGPKLMFAARPLHPRKRT